MDVGAIGAIEAPDAPVPQNKHHVTLCRSTSGALSSKQVHTLLCLNGRSVYRMCPFIYK